MQYDVAIRELSAPELKVLLESRTPPIVVDVRTEYERAIAAIDGSQLLTKDSYNSLLCLDRATPIVFQCHHGIRSRAAAEHFLEHGFEHVYNLEGGIDAWSVLVDPGVPRY